MKNIFLENHAQNLVEKLSPDPFLKNQSWAYLWINILKFYIFYFSCLSSWGLSKMIKISCRPFAFTSYKAFLKNEKRPGTSLPALFSAWFLKKNMLVVIFYYLTKFQCLFTFSSWDIGQYVYFNYLLTRLWRQKFWN